MFKLLIIISSLLVISFSAEIKNDDSLTLKKRSLINCDGERLSMNNLADYISNMNAYELRSLLKILESKEVEEDEEDDRNNERLIKKRMPGWKNSNYDIKSKIQLMKQNRPEPYETRLRLNNNWNSNFKQKNHLYETLLGKK
jgi:hypothetical protein